MELYANELGHTTEMAATLYMVKPLKHLLQNQWSDDLGTWYEASSTQVLPGLSKTLPFVQTSCFMRNGI